MATVSEALNKAAVAQASVDRGRVLNLTFLDGQRAALSIASLPFSTSSASEARVSLDGSFVTLLGPDGTFEVTAHELAALVAGRRLDRPDLAKRVGWNLRAVRAERGLSLRDVARLSGIAAPNLSNFENGQVSPRLETLGRLAEVLEVTVADLVSVDPPEAASMEQTTVAQRAVTR